MRYHFLKILLPLLFATILSACNDHQSWLATTESNSLEGEQEQEENKQVLPDTDIKPLPAPEIKAGLNPCLEDAMNDDGHVWCAISFGQSTDVNFASTISPSKIGVNNVWLNDQASAMTTKDIGTLEAFITLESRGGKLANTHDGLTFYYTRLPTRQNFILEADITMVQFGPEVFDKNKDPPVLISTNEQEAAGLMVRDHIGPPRKDPLILGYEEFPSASNMVMNAVVTKNKNNIGDIEIKTIYRNGVHYPWGNTNAIIRKEGYQKDINYHQTPRFKLTLERTDTGYYATYANIDGSNPIRKWIAGAEANIVETIEPDKMYVGFFVARNARMVVENAKLILSPAQTVQTPKYVPEPEKLRLEVASPEVTTSATYVLQARASEDGQYSVRQDGHRLLAEKVVVKAGQYFSLPTHIVATDSQFYIEFIANNGEIATTDVMVHKLTHINGDFLYVAPDGLASNDGSLQHPLDLKTALHYVAPGGTISLLEGRYGKITFPIETSGSPQQLKKMVADAPGKVIFADTILLNAGYWHLKEIEVAGAQLRISGSFNIVERVVVHHHIDTGLQISAAGKGRAFWPSYNLILQVTSYANKDPSMINADGFAAKLGVGDGNIFRGCVAYDNADDGWDLFNKIEDGANGVVIIEDSIAHHNGNNGFKLGGEGQPVPHIVRNNLAFHNGMDGFTDNFNPGRIIMQNNTAFDNVRYNYIFRPSPYGGIETQGVFSNNLSWRTDYTNKYDDAVHGIVDATNTFILYGQPTKMLK